MRKVNRMKVLQLFGLLHLAFSPAALGQALPAAGDFSHLPTYLVGVGLEANPTGVLTTLAIRIGQTRFYSWTTLDTPTKQASSQIISSVRTGGAYVAAHSGSCFLFFLGDAGFSNTSDAATLGAYSGGGGVFCTSRRFPQLYVGPVLRAVKISSSTVSPIAEIFANWSF